MSKNGNCPVDIQKRKKYPRVITKGKIFQMKMELGIFTKSNQERKNFPNEYNISRNYQKQTQFPDSGSIPLFPEITSASDWKPTGKIWKRRGADDCPAPPNIGNYAIWNFLSRKIFQSKFCNFSQIFPCNIFQCFLFITVNNTQFFHILLNNFYQF